MIFVKFPRKYPLLADIADDISDIMQIDFENETILGNKILQMLGAQLKTIY